MTAVYPFSAIVGQERMKRALILSVVDPSLHGVLVRGERGTAKSTAVRALVHLLPEQVVVKGCSFGCDPADPGCPSCQGRWAADEDLPVATRRMPLVDMPLGATEDRVLGTVDIESALREGRQMFRPGLLAEVHRGILYVDEVNLLGDHLMDVLLDAAAMGVNVVEREGVSHSHPSRFILVGTMNPEEGNLRPQLTDRFDLGVDVAGTHDADERREVLRRRLDFETDPAGFASRWREQEKAVAEVVVEARSRLPGVAVGEADLDAACALAGELELDGHRAEIAMIKAARAIAALEGELAVSPTHLEEAAVLAVVHRLRKMPLDDGREDAERLERSIGRLRRRLEGRGEDAGPPAEKKTVT
jgi:Mg-chelatase subunit ChlI